MRCILTLGEEGLWMDVRCSRGFMRSVYPVISQKASILPGLAHSTPTRPEIIRVLK